MKRNKIMSALSKTRTISLPRSRQLLGNFRAARRRLAPQWGVLKFWHGAPGFQEQKGARGAAIRRIAGKNWNPVFARMTGEPQNPNAGAFGYKTKKEVVRAGIEPATPGFSVQCSTN
jgi:hypothetical protein